MDWMVMMNWYRETILNNIPATRPREMTMNLDTRTLVIDRKQSNRVRSSWCRLISVLSLLGLQYIFGSLIGGQEKNNKSFLLPWERDSTNQRKFHPTIIL